MMEEASTSSLADAMPALVSLGKVMGVLLLLGTGNILYLGLAYWMWKKHKAQKEADEARAAGLQAAVDSARPKQE